MHILFVPAYYPTVEAPITGVFFQDQAIALHRAGHKVGVLVTPRINVTINHFRKFGLRQLKATTLDTNLSAEFPVYRMHWGWFPRPFPFMVALLLAHAGEKAFEHYIREHGMPDVIHGHNIFYGGYLASRLSRKYHVPAVITEYSSSYLEGLIIFPGQGTIIRETLKQTKVNMVCGTSLIKPLQSFAPNYDFETLGCVVDTDFFSPAPKSPDTPFKFLVIAQLKERRKGFDVLLKAFAQAFHGRTDVILQIRGHGPLRAELDTLIQQLNIEAQVQFLPPMTKEQIRDLIRDSHCLVSSSYIETFGVSVAEAIACGKPVVSTISGGPEDFVTENSGILVSPGDIDALADAMGNIHKNYQQYDPQRVREDVTSRYSAPIYVQKLEAIYGRAIQDA